VKSFLLNSENKPVVRWGLIPDGVFYEGTIPEGYSLATCPSGNIVILDIDAKNGKNGYEHIPHLVQIELDNTFNYKTKSGGGHCWIAYTGDKDSFIFFTSNFTCSYLFKESSYHLFFCSILDQDNVCCCS